MTLGVLVINMETHTLKHDLKQKIINITALKVVIHNIIYKASLSNA